MIRIESNCETGEVTFVTEPDPVEVVETPAEPLPADEVTQ